MANPKEQKQKDEEKEILVRVMGYDIPGSKNLYTGLTRIKGVSWTISNAACIKLNFPKSKKVSELSKDDIKKIEDFLKELPLPEFLKNRRFDRESGKSGHFYGIDLDLKKEFDIKRHRKIKSYVGIRHAARQPVRGQRTRSHFRQKGKAVGVKKKKLGKKA
jgi:small subunit ribosomal protein S13